MDGAVSPEAAAAHEAYQALIGKMVWYNQQTGALDAAGVDFDILDDASIATATAGDGRLQIAGESYRTLILPACTVLDPATAATLVRFAEDGGDILAVGCPPTSLAGDDPDHLLERLTARLTVMDIEGLRARLAATPGLVDAPVPTLVRRIDDATVVFVPAAFPGASRISGRPVATIDFDRSAYAGDMTIRVRDVEGIPELWNPFQGTRTLVPRSRCRAVPGGVEVDLPFDPAPCAILVWGKGEDGAPVHAMVTRVIAQLEDTWDVVLAPTLDNQWGDFTFPASPAPMPVQHWTFTDPGDAAEVRPIVATYGPRAQWTGPGDAAALAPTGNPARWKTASWSLARGIHKDPIHRRHLGPAGHVPEEFIEFGTVAAGKSVRLRFGFDLNTGAVFGGWFVIGAAATKCLQIDGRDVAIDPQENLRYQSAAPVTLEPGPHTVDLVLTSRHDALTLRAWFALITDMERCRRPDRLTVAGNPEPETEVRFATCFTIDRAVRSGTLQVGTRGPARILLDGREIGRQGGYLPYGDGSATQRYDITDLLAPGEHVLAIGIDDTALPVTLVVDGVVRFEDGSDDLWLMTDPAWTVTRDDRPAELAIEARPAGDPQLAHLRQRPHPLPGAAWLEGEAADPGVVVPLAPYTEAASMTQRLRCVVPPGAVRATIPVAGHATATLDGEALGEADGTPCTGWTVSLPGPDRVGRVLDLIVETVPGYAGGAALTAPLSYEVGPGRLPLGDWERLGLAGYSGMVRYQQEVRLPEPPADGAVYLDLGDVRGSVEVKVNGQAMGTCVTAPYRVEITPALRAAAGVAAIEVIVANTLGPHLQAVSPTPFVLNGQTVSGLFGPVRLLHVRDDPDREAAT